MFTPFLKGITGEKIRTDRSVKPYESRREVTQMPKVKRGLTTGDGARMLGVSRSKVERLFDQGVLTGWKHPIVGWRSIDRESVEALTKKSKGWFRRGRLRKTTSRPSSENEIPPPNQGLTTREVAKMLG